jgi:pimeloyl-ACP methyl ester carboxylesterase
VLALLGVVPFVALRTDLPANEVDTRHRVDASRFVTLADGTRMHYLDAGAKDAPVLVLVHGSFDSAFTWARVMPDLAREFRVIALDLPAHGLTGRTARDAYTMNDMVAAVHGLVEHLGLARFDLGGNSMGGNTSWLYALAHPGHVRKLVLIDAAGYPATGAPLVDTNAGAVKSFFYRWGNPALLVRRGMRRAVADPASLPDGYVARSVDFVRRKGSREAHMIRNRVRAIHEQPFHRMGEITAPSLIVWGDRDTLLPVDAAHRFHADLPHSDLRIYTGIGHMPQLEAPGRLIADMRAFLDAE